MKKFLFTLLTLFMASSAFAGDYFYIDNITLTKEEAAAGCKKIAYVKAHFDNAVSAWQVDLTLPEGVTIDVAQPAADMTLTYLDKFTDEETMDTYYAENTYTPNLANSNGYTRFIVSVFTTVEYDQEGNSYGICWRPGDYDAMWRVRLVIPAGFKGGDLNVHTAPSGPAKPYPGLTTSDKVPSDHVTAIRIKADTPEIAVDGDQYKKTVTITAEEGATIYYSTDGESYNVYNEPVVFDKAGTYTVYAYAEGPGEEPEKKSKSDVATSEQFTIVEQVVETIEKPVITFSGEETTEMTVTVSCATEGVTLYVNGEAVEGNPYSYIATRADVYTAGTVEVTAVAKKGELESEVASDSKAWVVQQKPEAPVPTFNWDPDTYTMEAVCQGHTVVLMANGVQVSNPYTVAQTTEDQTIEFSAYTVANADESGNSETIKQTVTVPAKPLLELTGKITFSVTQGNKNEAGTGIVTATYDGPETGVTVKIVGNPTQVAAATSEGVQLPDYGTYQVKAVASATGYADLDGEGEVTWEEPQTDAPEFNVSQDGLTVEATGKGTVKLYIVNADGSETEIDNPTAFDQKDEAYTVNLKAVAHVDGAKDGVATTSIVIPAKSSEHGTGVDELVDGKAVKSVRYFNMAGQEMQEVNGVTIVVTTYTDGTTSAVKVMK